MPEWRSKIAVSPNRACGISLFATFRGSALASCQSTAALIARYILEMSDSSDNEGRKSKSSNKWADKLRYLSPISKPLAGRKETKHILKLVKKGKYLTPNHEFKLFWAH